MRNYLCQKNRVRALLLLATGWMALPSLAGCNLWTRCGPELDRAPASVAVDPCAPGTLYVGSWDQGIFKTTDGGATWVAINEGLPVNPNGTIVAVRSLAVDPLQTLTVYAGVDSIGYFPSVSCLVFKTTNGGASWRPACQGLPTGINTIVPLVIDPSDPNILYGAPGTGLFKTLDGGASWFESDDGLPWESVEALILDPNDPRTLYAGMGDCFDGGVYKTADGGASWMKASQGLGGPWDCISVYALALNPSDPRVLFAEIPTGLFKTSDSGNSWRNEAEGFPVGSGGPLVIDPDRTHFLYTGDYGGTEGIFRSTDGGTLWYPFNKGLPVRFGTMTLALFPSTTPTLYTGSYAITIAPVPGDCDEDSEVSIGEVQRAINMFVWGTTPACGVDRDGDGSVSIGEVQTVINGFLGVLDPCSL